MSTTTMHFGPEWMRTKHQPLPRSQPPPSPPPANVLPGSGFSTYSALVSATPPVPSESTDEVHPFRYSKEELLKIYQEGGGKGGLGLEVERWEGVVREGGAEPVTLREMTEGEKKLFAGPLNSELRRRPSQSTEFLSPLTTSGLDRPRLTHNSSSATTNSPLRERFGALKRRDSAAGASDTAVPTLPRKPSLSTLQTPSLSPRDAPRPRAGYTTSFDGVLNSGESWMTRRRTSETPTKSDNGPSREINDSQHDVMASGIREEKEDDPRINSQPRDGEDRNFSSSSSPRMQSEEPRLYAAAAASGTASSLNPSQVNCSPASGTMNSDTLPSDVNDIGPPPGLIDLAAVEWSYKDPTGLVQGPFRADLMQKWYNDGYFSSDLPMKRVRYDSQWTSVAELLQRASGENIFLSSPLATNSLDRGNGSPSQIYPSSEHVFNEPYQPAPIRSLRPSTLESYLNTGSLASDSPSSSVGASLFGNPSPDPSAFGGRDSKSYFGGDLNGRLSGFGTQERPLSFGDRRIIGLDLQPNPSNNIHGPSFGNFVPDRDINFNEYAYNNIPIPHDSWAMASNIPSNTFIGARDQGGDKSFVSNLPPTELGQAQRHPEGDPLSRTYNQGMIFTNDVGNFNSQRTGPGDPNTLNYGHYDFAGQSSFQNLQDQHQQYPSPAREYVEGAVGLYTFHGSNVEPLAPESSQNISSNLSTMPTVPWTSLPDSSASHRLGQPETLQITTTASIVPSTAPSQFPWNRIDQASTIPSQTNDSSAPGTFTDKESPWKDEAIPSSLTAGNLGQHNQQQESSEKVAIQKPLIPGPPHSPSGSVSVSDGSVPIPAQSIPKKPSKTPPQANHQAPLTTPTDTSATPTAQKVAWAKEEEGKRKAGANASVSLREIQEAEAKKLETRKAVEREKERLARASASAETKEDIQPFTTSWGLPTSQAGARGSVPVRDVSVAPGPTPAATPVWTTPLNKPTVKKTMKEIQEEEEVRKKLASRENSPAVAQKRAYAETTNKVVAANPPPISNNNNAWTTVGPSGKSSTAVPPPVRPSAQPTASFSTVSTSASRASASPVQRVSANATLKPKPSPKLDEAPESPSHDFLKWLSDSLKGLNTSVNVEEIVSMLLSFPLDPDASTLEIISDTIYSNSTTLDGRRFASEFVAKRKADAVARTKGTATSGKTPMKPVSIADVVKATPKAAQPEWGFKVVNKKKKGGRS